MGGGALGDELLGVRIVDGEGGADGDGPAALAREREQRVIEGVTVDASCRVEEGVRGLELPVRREPDRPDPGALAGRPQVRRLAEADHADAATSPSSSAFIACVVENATSSIASRST